MAILKPARPHVRTVTVGILAILSLATLSLASAEPRSRLEKTPGVSAETLVVETAPAAMIPAGRPWSSPARNAEGSPDPALAAGESPQEPVARVAASSTSSPDWACSWSADEPFRFSGSGSIRTDDDGVQLHYRIGTRDGDRLIQVHEGNRRLCLVAEGDVSFTGTGQIASLAPGATVVLEARGEDGAQRLEITGTTEAPERVWRVDGVERPYDAAARRWRDAMLEVLGIRWQMSQIRGQVSSLRGEISSIRGQRSSLRGQISSARGQVSSMRGQISSIRGQESSLRGQISSIRGQVSSMRGQISSERGQISSLRARRHNASEQQLREIEDKIREHEARIEEIEERIRDYDAEARIAEVEGQIRALETEERVEEIERRIEAFDLDSRVEAIEAEIEALDVEGKVEEIEARIDSLDAEGRIQELEMRLQAQLTMLSEAIAAIR